VPDLKRFAFGSTAAVMTSMALIEGLGSADSGKPGIIAGLLIIGITDNLSDSLGIHIHEESELHGRQALALSASNYGTRLLVVISFITLVLALPLSVARILSVVWGIALLSTLTYFIARARRAKPAREIAIHLVVAAVVIALSQGIGLVIGRVI
jgi:hypothetical protein